MRVESLDRYLKTQAGQDVRRKANAVFVLRREAESERVMGHYTLCAMAISQSEVPESARNTFHLIRLSVATLIGRLAVAKEEQGRHLGSISLRTPLDRAFESAGTVGSMVIVDALDEAAAGFYAAHGLVRVPDLLRLVLPIRLAGAGSEQ